MKIFVKCFYSGVMPGPSAWMRDRLVPCTPRPITTDLRDGPASSNIHSRISERAGLTRDRALQFSAKLARRDLPNGRTVFVGT